MYFDGVIVINVANGPCAEARLLKYLLKSPLDAEYLELKI